MEKYKILLAKRAHKQLQKISPPIRQRLLNALQKLSLNPELGKRLQGELRPYRSFRVGDYRIVYEMKNKILTIHVLYLGHRREVYEIIKR